jgi:hypothetical protein
MMILAASIACANQYNIDANLVGIPSRPGHVFTGEVKIPFGPYLAVR